MKDDDVLKATAEEELNTEETVDEVADGWDSITLKN